MTAIPYRDSSQASYWQSSNGSQVSATSVPYSGYAQPGGMANWADTSMGFSKNNDSTSHEMQGHDLSKQYRPGISKQSTHKAFLPQPSTSNISYGTSMKLVDNHAKPKQRGKVMPVARTPLRADSPAFHYSGRNNTLTGGPGTSSTWHAPQTEASSAQNIGLSASQRHQALFRASLFKK